MPATKGSFPVGTGTYGVEHLTIRAWRGPTGDLRIGKYCSLGEDITIYLGGNHRTDWITTYPFIGAIPCQATRGDVIIGNDVWIGAGVLILSGVTIGDGAIIGARAVVARSVPPYTVAAGNPAKPVRERFSPDERDLLLRMQWWNWPKASIEEAAPLLCSANLEGLRRYWEEHIRAMDTS